MLLSWNAQNTKMSSRYRRGSERKDRMQTKVGLIDSISAHLKSSKLSIVFFKKNGRFLRNPENSRCVQISTFDVPGGSLHFEQIDVKRSPKPQSFEAFVTSFFVTFERKYENKYHILFVRRYHLYFHEELRVFQV